jgi:hypothetical protein
MFDLQWTDEAERAYRALEQRANQIKGKREEKQKSKSSNQEGLFKQARKTLSSLFYQEILGQKPIEESPTFVMFTLKNGVMLGLWSKTILLL